MKSTTQRRMFSLLLALVMLFSLLPALGSTASAAGSGTTESDPKIVTTYAELSSALSSGTAYVKLGANINTKGLNDGAGYTKSIQQTGTVQLDLDGYSVTFFSRTSPLPAAIRVKGDLSVKDSRGGKLYIDANPNTGSSKQVLIHAETGSFTLNSGRIGVDNGLAKNSIVVVEGKGDAKVVFNGGKVDAISPKVGIPYVYSALLSSNCKAEFNGGEFEGLVGFTYATRTDGISKPKAVINGGKFKGGIVVKKGSETITEGRSFPISIRGGSFGRGLFTENFALSSSEQTPENFAFAAMFPERTALLRPDERTRLIYRQKDVKTEYMANSVSKEYLIALSTKNLDDYKRVAFSSYSGTGTLKYANEEWKPGKWAEAIWNDDWTDMDNISAGACYKLHDESDTNMGGLWLNRLELTNLNLSVKAPVAGESPAPGSDYCKIDGLPPYMTLERVDWLKCYDDWTYYSDKPFTFQAGKTSDGESCEYQCFIYVSYDLSGVGVAKGAKFYLNDTPCKLDWEKKFFWTETMTAEGTPVQEDPVITAKAGANGTITPSGNVTVKAGADQAFAIQPNSGYTVSKVLVDGTDVGAVTSYTFKNVTANHTIEAVFAKVEAKPTNPFVDVAEGTYYYDPVLWAVANGITSGVDATHFDPNGTCTRAHAVTFLWRAAGQPEPKTTQMPFKDVKAGSYYEKAVLWAVENKITNGTSTTTFSPDKNCTRAQIVTFLWRSEGEPYASDSNNPFTDIASGYYMDAVFWAVKEGITNGTTPTTFSPNDRCTRAQIVTFIYRAMHL